MADSTLDNTGESPPGVSGKGKRTLGPSDTSDSGSDLTGTGPSAAEDENTSDSHNTGEEWGEVRSVSGTPGSDIEPDKIVDTGERGIDEDDADVAYTGSKPKK